MITVTRRYANWAEYREAMEAVYHWANSANGFVWQYIGGEHTLNAMAEHLPWRDRVSVCEVAHVSASRV